MPQYQSLRDAAVSLPEHVHVFGVGAGFGGIGLAIKLQEAGESDFLIADRGHEVGGTWRDNHYPGAACDVPSQMYSFSFALNPNWSRIFSPQPEILAYLRKVATEAGVLDRFRFGVRFESATWDEDEQRWQVETTAGSLTADILVSASGGLSEPKMPDIAGIDTFKGQIMHSAEWNHDVDLAGKRVAVIGTGASAIQIVPQVAKAAAQLDVYQRTAPWIIPRNEREYSSLEKLAYDKVPGLQRAHRTLMYWGAEVRVPAFTLEPRIAYPAKQIALQNIKRGIKDPELRKKVTPNFTFGCKRVLISNEWYPALDRDNVDLITEPIKNITAKGITTADGVNHPIDVLIVATGFQATELPIASQIKGRDGLTLADAWQVDGVNAYKGTTVAGFPNLFMICGPNTGLGHSSMVFMIESQVAYIVDAVRTMRQKKLASVDVKPFIQQHWNSDLQRRMARTVWQTGGCASWYMDAKGRNSTLWPRATFVFRALLAKFDLNAYRTVSATAAVSSRVGRTDGQTAGKAGQHA